MSAHQVRVWMHNRPRLLAAPVYSWSATGSHSKNETHPNHQESANNKNQFSIQTPSRYFEFASQSERASTVETADTWLSVSRRCFSNPSATRKRGMMYSVSQ